MSGVLDAAERYAQALAAEQRAKLRFTSYAARDAAVRKRKAARVQMVEAVRALGVATPADVRTAGTLLANMAYNLAQDSSLSDEVRFALDDGRKRWDAALDTPAPTSAD